MNGLHTALVTVIAVLFRPVDGLGPWGQLAAISLLTGALVLAVYRWTSDQVALQRAKSRLWAALYEVALFRHDLRLLFRAEARLVRSNLIYLGHSLRPIMVLVIPVSLLLAGLHARLSFQPVAVGECFVLSAETGRRTSVDELEAIRVTAGPGLVVETPGIRAPADGRVSWRMRAAEPGRHCVSVVTGNGLPVEKAVVVGTGQGPVSVERIHGGVLSILASPAEAALPAKGALKRISVEHTTSGRLGFAFVWLHWVWWFLILTTAFVFGAKGWVRVEV